MRNECVIKETLDAVVMQEAQIERLVERCREGKGKRRTVRSFRKSFVSVAAACVLFLMVGAVTVYAVVSHSFMDRFKGSEEDIAYVYQLIAGEPQTISMNGLLFTVENYVFEENTGEGYFVLKITREDGTKPEAMQSQKLQMASPRGSWALYLDGLPYIILFQEMWTQEELQECCERTVLEKEETWELLQNTGFHMESKEFADAVCYDARFWTEETGKDFAIYILQTDDFSLQALEEKVESKEGIFLTESVSEATSLANGQLTVILSPFSMQLNWVGELPVPTYVKKTGQAPVEEILVVKKDGTQIKLVEDFMPVAETLAWSGGRHNKDYRTDIEHHEETYQFLNLLNLQEVDYLLINGEKMTEK
ncbi:MAG: hypothetical protein IJX63_08520 [Lachnospiraceae bacterium]|nr:hypothetical protein [Lachnospiraceae bacterium]